MYKTFLDKVSYFKETGLISYAIAYAYNGEEISKLGVWHRDDIVNAIKSGLNVSRAIIEKQVEGKYCGQQICSVEIVEIDDKVYLKNSNYRSDMKKEDMIEMNYGIKMARMS